MQTQSDARNVGRRVEQVRAALREQRKLQSALHAADTYREQLWEQHRHLQTAHQSLEDSLKRYVELFDFAPIGYLIFDEVGVILDANLTAVGWLEIDRMHLMGRPFLALVSEDHRPKFLAHMVRARTEEAAITELELLLRSGALIPVQLHTRRTTPEDMRGEPKYLTAMIDLSELRRGEAERARLRQRQHEAESANRARDRFLAMLSHELRTPLTPVLAAVSSPGLTPPQEMPSLLAMIRRNIEIEARLIEDLLDVSRVDHGKLHLRTEALDVHQLVEDVVRSLGEQFRKQPLEVTCELHAGRRWVRADPLRLRQVLNNLLTNAIKYTPADGSVMLRTLNLEPGSITLSVRDTGIGLAPEQIARLFHPFTQAIDSSPQNGDQPNTAGRSGLGLGLAICRGIMEAHGGKITAHSEGIGHGSTFELTLKTIAAPAPIEPPAPAEVETTSEPATRSLRIMLVEDHRDTARIMSRLLAQCGHEVRVARTLGEAVSLAHEQDDFDVIISDLGLPDGSGLDLMRRIGDSPGMPAIALSGFATEDDRRRSRQAGFQEHLSKPVDVNQLLSTIAQVAGQRQD